MAAIQNEADIVLQATSPRLLSSPLNYLSIIPNTNTITSSSGVLTPSAVNIIANLSGALQGTVSWSLVPSVTYSTITGGISITSTDLPAGTSVLVTASLTYAGNVYSSSTTITRKQSVQLSSLGVLLGEDGGAITNLDYGNVGGTKPPSNATANFFTTSTLDPSGGADGDAHYNSSTNVMWFKVSGVWTQGGTINANAITVGTLAAARIATNSITADKIATGTITATQIAAGTITSDKITVSSLSVLSPDLGSITSGNIAGTTTIDGTSISGVKNSNITLGPTGVLNGAGGGSITSLDYGNVSGSKPPTNATANFFTTSINDPVGGVDGDAHWNSTSSTMWFKIGGIWRVGGTINAGQITVGTLAAARIAANSITADKMNVTTLSAVSTNLGSVTAGSITGTSSINIAGSARFTGQTNDGGSLYTIVADASSISFGGGIKGNAGSNGVGVYGDTGTSGDRGVAGVSRISGSRAIQAINTAGGWALDVSGYMTINNSTLVANLNAQKWNGHTAASNDTTGATTASFISTNKPGSSSTSNSWLQITLGTGEVKYIPVWA